jgi:predicted thioesterase
MTIEIGATDYIEYKVGERDLAKNLSISKEDNFPEVFTTGRLVSLMECTAAKIMIPYLEEGQLSVGVGIEIKHMAPTLNGDVVISTAKFTGKEETLYKFTIMAEDSGGLVVKGTHTRAVIDEKRLLSVASKRIRKSARSA